MGGMVRSGSLKQALPGKSLILLCRQVFISSTLSHIVHTQIMYEVLNQGLINPAAAQGADGGWHTTSDTLHGYARKVAEVSGREGEGGHWGDDSHKCCCCR